MVHRWSKSGIQGMKSGTLYNDPLWRTHRPGLETVLKVHPKAVVDEQSVHEMVNFWRSEGGAVTGIRERWVFKKVVRTTAGAEAALTALIVKVSAPADANRNSGLFGVVTLRTMVSPKAGCAAEGNPHSNRSLMMDTGLLPKLGVHWLFRVASGEAEVPARAKMNGRTNVNRVRGFMVVWALAAPQVHP